MCLVNASCLGEMAYAKQQNKLHTLEHENSAVMMQQICDLEVGSKGVTRVVGRWMTFHCWGCKIGIGCTGCVFMMSGCCTMSFYYDAAAASWSSDLQGMQRALFASKPPKRRVREVGKLGADKQHTSREKLNTQRAGLHNVLLKSCASAPALSDCTWTANPERARGATII
jgi:hypothetical protein